MTNKPGTLDSRVPGFIHSNPINRKEVELNKIWNWIKTHKWWSAGIFTLLFLVGLASEEPETESPRVKDTVTTVTQVTVTTGYQETEPTESLTPAGVTCSELLDMYDVAMDDANDKRSGWLQNEAKARAAEARAANYMDAWLEYC